MSNIESTFRTANRTELMQFCLRDEEWDNSGESRLLEIARDSSLSVWRRRSAIVQLFLRFSLSKSVRMLAEDWRCAQWAPSTDIHVPQCIGPCPLYFNPSEQASIAVLKPSKVSSVDRTAIYLCLSGIVQEAALRKSFEHEKCEFEANILDVGIYEVYKMDGNMIYDASWVHPCHAPQHKAAIETFQRILPTFERIWKDANEWA